MTDVTMPDGTVIQDVPDGITQRELLRRYSALPGLKAVAVSQADSNLPPGLPPALGAFLVGAGKQFARIGQGIRQLMPGDNSALDAQVAEENRLYAPLAAAHPIATGLGEASPAMAVPVGAAASVPAALGRAAIASAAPGALEYGTAAERAQRAGIGAVAGAAGAGLAYGLGRAVSPVRIGNPAASGEISQIADHYGVPLTAGQITGSKPLQSLEGTLATFPGSAAKMAKVQQAQRDAFDRAAMTTMGEAPTSVINADTAQVTKANIGDRIQSAAANVPVQLNTDSVINGLAAVESKYMRNLNSLQKPFVRNAIDDILNAGDSVPGATYQAWRSRIGAMAKGTSDSEFKGALKGLQGVLDDAFDASAGSDASAAMSAARNQYRNFKTLEPLLHKAGMSTTNIPPAQVVSRAIASGNTLPEMQQLAQLGSVMKEYANSGTGPRLFWQSIFENPLRALNPVLGVGAPTTWALAQAINSGPGRAYLTNQAITPELERLLMRGGGLLGYGAERATALGLGAQ